MRTTSHSEPEFAAFVQAAWPQLRQAAFALTGDRDRAEDLLQTVLVRTCTRWARVRRGDPVAYVRRALLNAWIDQYRRRRVMAEDAVAEPDAGAVADESETVGLRADLAQRLAVLSARERTMVVMRHYLDLPEAEVAEAMGCSVGTVKSTCSRALARLRIPIDETRGDPR
ncbi:SigE family RNA polymerase sigma factor [Nocardioides marinquilinus]|uniref:SigE family RNA polymerase sigma factor n=1 Tax=Nocardioides marinquilinus TaxID=1210400 RepID=A0ABP9PY61_9ACTN